ncbi:hypothetical protein HMPREF9136_1721 [Prevotella dentalis DSM 3688]|uniref:Uncharacterized protein n=1 Tax=Prevotella dentalis (strain ATCC 49559 / DSM 3688 / JCM 13448 / NCTC 12043 / ES 2772) TaxID=908937 RepID=F9D4E3_PREDD|nr:hypothetical protein HMPREF9136_1721 [Prevotella dentalis DSM 3688]
MLVFVLLSWLYGLVVLVVLFVANIVFFFKIRINILKKLLFPQQKIGFRDKL